MTRMDVREKMVELLRNSPHLDTVKGYKGNDCTFEQGADWLVAHGVTVQEWISVTERLPEKGEEVLVFNTRENWIGFAWLRPDETWTALGFDFPFDLGEVTHWMPLPQPPKGE